MSVWPRWLHHLYATMNGYFWMPCPLCAEPFGGHEPGPLDEVTTGEHSAQMVCPPCGAALADQHRRVCDSQGCEPIEIWSGGTQRVRAGSVSISLDLDREPDVRCCRHCRRPTEAR